MPVRHVVEPVDEVEHEEGCREDVAGQLIDAAGQEAVAPAVGLADGELGGVGGGRGLLGAPAVGLLGRGVDGRGMEGGERRGRIAEEKGWREGGEERRYNVHRKENGKGEEKSWRKRREER